eukprot:1182813-Amphidinium_carterae.1
MVTVTVSNATACCSDSADNCSHSADICSQDPIFFNGMKYECYRRNELERRSSSRSTKLCSNTGTLGVVRLHCGLIDAFKFLEPQAPRRSQGDAPGN